MFRCGSLWSYSIEPNPSARGAASKFYYPSHRLRFDVQRPLDASTADFVARVNAAAQREDDGDSVNPRDPDWYLGERQRHRGSLHQDVWEGTAADLRAEASSLSTPLPDGGGPAGVGTLRPAGPLQPYCVDSN